MAERLEKLIDKATPRYTITLPLTKITVTYRPFLVKEEKVLLISTADLADDDIVGRYRAILLLLENCTDLIDVGNLPLSEVDWLFVQIRSKSKIEGDLPDPKIMLTDKMGIILSPPTLNDTISCHNKNNEVDIFCVLKKTIQEIFTEDYTITRKEMNEDDLTEFVDSLLKKQTDKIYEYYSNIPRIQKEVIYSSASS